MFHSVIAKFLFTSNYSLQDISPTVSALSSRVREVLANKKNREKGRKLVKYSNFTKVIHLVSHYYLVFLFPGGMPKHFLACMMILNHNLEEE